MPKQPNIVVCLTDMFRSFAVGCYGNAHVRTPNIDRLAAEGVRFELAVSNNPVCVPARGCLMSGQYSRTCMGALDNFDGLWPNAIRNRLPDPTLAECLREAGYATALIGKWHLDPDPLLCGFDQALYPRVIHRHYGQQYVENNGAPFVVDGFAPDFEMQRVDAYLAEQRDRPFFLFHNISQPHMPVGPGHCPDCYLAMYDKATVPLRPNVYQDGVMAHDREWFIIYTDSDYWYRKWFTDEPKRPTDTVPDDYDLRDLTAQYYALVTCADDQVGALMRGLETHGVADNTIVIFTSDHGDNLGSHGKFNKQLLIEESIRIPFIVWAPEHLRPAVNREQIAQLIDVMPTALDLCGVDIPSGVQGRSLAPALRGDGGPPTAARDEAAFVETSSGLIGMRTATHLYGMQLDANARAIVDDALEFYDLRSDPYETHNMAKTEEQADEANRLRTKLKHWHDTTPRVGPPHRTEARPLENTRRTA